MHCPKDQGFDARLVRLNGPEIGKGAPDFRPEIVPAGINGTYTGQEQSFAIGSYAFVPNLPEFGQHQDYTFAAFVFPTTPAKGRQAIIGTWNDARKTGFGLEIGPDGALGFRVSTANGDVQVLSTDRPMRASCWYKVAVIISGQNVSLIQEMIGCPLWETGVRCRVQATLNEPFQISGTSLSMAAWAAEPDFSVSDTRGVIFSCHLNGKVERPVILNKAVGAQEIGHLLERPASEFNRQDVVAAWDFSLNIPDEKITDIGPHGVEGVIVNQPARGVTGVHWQGDDFDWKHAPDQYAAIHFHDDDISDLNWKPSFSFEIPKSMSSAVYAIHLTSGEQDFWIPFFVRPKRGVTPKPSVVFLAPTATYLAYVNHRSRFNSVGSERLHGRLKILDDIDLAFIGAPKLGVSTYDSHSDGSGVAYTSRYRPAANFRPTGHLWNFSLDLLILNWLEHAGIEYDVVTDEDLHEEGQDLLSPYAVVLTGSHPEYVSQNMLNGLERYVQDGGRLMYLGGNGFYWRTVFHPDRAGIIEVRRSNGVRSWECDPGEGFSSFSGENMGTWRANGRAPQRLTGVGYVAQGFNRGSGYRKTQAAADTRISWAFEHVTDDRFGEDSIYYRGAAGVEIDGVDPRLGTPPHALVIASSAEHTNLYELASEEVLTPHGATDGISNPNIRADMVFFETPAGGAVFSTGSIAFATGLAWNGYDNGLNRLTTTMLKRFIDPTPFPFPAKGPSS